MVPGIAIIPSVLEPGMHGWSQRCRLAGLGTLSAPLESPEPFPTLLFVLAGLASGRYSRRYSRRSVSGRRVRSGAAPLGSLPAR